jgi:hypothetical protein
MVWYGTGTGTGTVPNSPIIILGLRGEAAILDRNLKETIWFLLSST